MEAELYGHCVSRNDRRTLPPASAEIGKYPRLQEMQRPTTQDAPYEGLRSIQPSRSMPHDSISFCKRGNNDLSHSRGRLGNGLVRQKKSGWDDRRGLAKPRAPHCYLCFGRLFTCRNTTAKTDKCVTDGVHMKNSAEQYQPRTFEVYL